jgi:hypothetical protein
MRKPCLWESNPGALVGGAVGAVGGLFAVGIAPAILYRDPRQLLGTPLLGFIGWVISGPLGWFIGGQIGPRLGAKLGERNGNVIGGILGGMVPVVSIALWGWHMATK